MAPVARQGGRRVNLALGALLAVAIGSGPAATTIGVDWPLDLIQVHAAAAVAVLLLAPWKSTIVRRGLRRRRGQPVRWLSLTLLGSVLVTIGSGLLHATGRVEYVGPLTLMQVHVGAAVLAVAAAAGHVRAHPVRLRTTDPDRRALLRAGAVGGGAALAVAAWEGGLDAAGRPGGTRRFTGSVEQPRGDPAAMPVTSWLDDAVPRIDPARWQLQVAGTRLDLAAVLALPHETCTATLDCTGGWFAEQDWSGVRLRTLLDAAGAPATGFRSVRVDSATGYARWFGLATLDDVWLVTGVAGAPLSRGHGFPARVVAPGRRGFWWVKWVTSVQPSSRPAWAQSVFPLT